MTGQSIKLFRILFRIDLFERKGISFGEKENEGKIKRSKKKRITF